MIKREVYLNKIISFRDKPLIKAITGLRRSGKSTLLDLYEQYLKDQHVPAENIIHLNFEWMGLDAVRDYHQLYTMLKEKIQGKAPVYLLLDEIQQVCGWERAINSLFAEGLCDIYLTGSNARLLSSEISTLLSGRYVEIQVFPLSFQEYLQFRPEAARTPDAAFQQYLRFGGMPIIPALPQTTETIKTVLSGVYDTVLMKDVVQRNDVRDSALLGTVVRYLADTIGNPISTAKISGYLTSKGRKTSVITIDNYLGMLEEAFIFYRARRFDIKRKLYLRTLEKFYIVDTGLRNMLLGFRTGDYGHILENVVYLELRRRGYEVGVGKLGNLEVDFVATRPDRKVYYQVAASVQDAHTLERELTPLQKIPDQYEKILLTMDRDYIEDYNGIRKQNIIDFLLEKE